MISKIINFSTGPLQLPKEVRNCLAVDPVSDRSPEFQYLFDQTADLFNEKFCVKDFYLLSGSGTLANEAMIQQIRMSRQKGLIMSNGEFGNRLIRQANTSQLDFITYRESTGHHFDMALLKRMIKENSLHWILFCHCETSSGIINDLQSIICTCTEHHLKSYVDCISTVGAMDINLSGVTMATASSGNGLCGIAGLAIVLSNTDVLSDGSIPNCMDFRYYQEQRGIPFTISSILLKSLMAGSRLKLSAASFRRTEDYAREIHKILKEYDLLPYDNFHVFTVAPTRYRARELGEHLNAYGMVSSYQSDYLEKRNWLQLALFGYYEGHQQRWGINRLKVVLEDMITQRSKIKGHFFELILSLKKV
ncbi:MAG TPA: aminotransferase class V-fold PLP-dependent enzyme [Puia sp.]